MNRFMGVLSIVVVAYLSFSTSIKAAEVTNLTVTSGEFRGADEFGGVFPFVAFSGPAALTSFGGYNLVNDFPTPIGWDPAVSQTNTHPSAVTGFVDGSSATNFFMASSHVLDPGGLTYNVPSGTVNGVQNTISNGDTIEFDMDAMFLNWNGNVFNVGGVATGVVSNVSSNAFNYTVTWTGILNGAPFPGQEYNLTFSGSGNVSLPVESASIVSLSVTGGEFSGAGGGAFPFVAFSGPAALTSFGGYNLVNDFPTPIGWDPAVSQTNTHPSAATGFVDGFAAANFFMASSHGLDPSGFTYNIPSGTVNGISNGNAIEFDIDGLFLNWNGNVFNVGGVATGTISNVSGNTFDYNMSWTGIVNAGGFVGQEYNLNFIGSGMINASPDGDLNQDGSVNAVDLMLATRAVLGTYPLTSIQLLHGDVAPLSGGVPNPDGIFNAADMLVIIRKASGLISF